MTIPATTAPGAYFLGILVDPPNTILETNEANNAAATGSFLVGPDLQVQGASAPSTAWSGGTVSVTETVRNAGSAAGAFSVGIYLSPDATITTADTLLASRSVPSLAAGVTSTATTSVAIPAGISGAYYVGVIADRSGQVAEAIENNNTSSALPIAIARDTTPPVITITGVNEGQVSNAQQLSTTVATFGYAPGGDAIQTVQDGAGRTTTYVRDDFGRVVAVGSSGTFKGGATLRFEFDERGNVRKKTGGGTAVSYDYDGLDRLLSISARGGAGVAGVDATLAYDGPGQKGRLASVAESGRTTFYEWDTSGRLRFEKVAVTGESALLTTEYRYDIDGYLDTIVYPSGYAVTYDRDDATKEVTAVREAGTMTGLLTEVEREPFGPVKSGWFGNGLPLIQAFNRRYEPVSVQSGPVNLLYAMSASGEVQGIAGGATSTGFTHDHLSRLTGFTPGAAGSESLRYEYAGDRLIAAWTIGAQPIRRMAFGYDDASNLSSVSTYNASGTSITKTVCLVHDALGRLVLVGEGSTASGGPDALGCRTESEVTQVIARYGYDALNRRVSRTDAVGKVTYFAFLPGGETLGEYERTGVPASPWRTVREYVWMDGRPVAQEEHPSASDKYTYFVHTDHIGLPRALTNSSGQEVWRATARPYGDIEETTFTDPLSGRAVVTNLRLPGQYDERLLASVGLQGPYYNWNRWYLPSIGRYLELDPIAKAGGFNGFYGPNWYGYAEGNPLRWTDRFGLDLTLEQMEDLLAVLYDWTAAKIPYKWDGKDRKGADCSGAVSSTYNEAGIKIGQLSSQQFKTSPLFKPATLPLQLGDVGVYTNPNHVIVYGGPLTGEDGRNAWSAFYTGGPPFGTASSSSTWFKGDLTWWRYVGSGTP